MELVLPLSRDLNFENDIFSYGDLSGYITVVDKSGKEDTDYKVVVKQDALFKDEWKVTICARPSCKRLFKFRKYWFKYNTITNAFVGQVFFLVGLRKRFIRIVLP